MVTDTNNQAFVFKTTSLNVPAPRDGEAPVKVEFDQAQQEKVDQLIRAAQGRAASELRAEVVARDAQLAALQAELTEAKSKAATTGNKEGAKDADALQALIDEMKSAAAVSQREVERLKELAKAKESDVSTARTETREVRKQVAMQDAASKIGFVDVSDAISLSKSSVKWSDERNQFVVTKDDGQERLNAAMEPMTLDEFFVEMATKKPHLVRSDMRGGSGSTESKGSAQFGKIPLEKLFGPKSDARLANNLAMSNKAEYLKQRSLAKEQGII